MATRSSKKSSPLKVVSPILKKYNTQRHPKLKTNLKFCRVNLCKIGNSTGVKQIQESASNTGDSNFLDTVTEENKDQLTDTTVNKSKEISPKIKQKNSTNSGKKKNAKTLKEVENMIEFLNLSNTDHKNKLEYNYAINFFKKVQEKLKDNENEEYENFLTLLENFENSGMTISELFNELTKVFSNHKNLIDDFMLFLTPGQSVECGILPEHLIMRKMLDFIHSLDYFFSQSPQTIKKIVSVLETLSTSSDLDQDKLVESVVPLLKGNNVLIDYFLQLLPNHEPSSHVLTEFEELKHSQLSNEDDFEVIELDDVDDNCGGDFCPCKCHKNSECIDLHCVSCRTKFVNGKIFIQVDKHLKPARVLFDTYDMNYHKKRLTGGTDVKNEPYKDALSPSKMNFACSSDDLKSDEEDVLKSRRSPKKSPKRKEKCSKKLCQPGETEILSIDFENMLEDEKCADVFHRQHTSCSSIVQVVTPLSADYTVTTDEDTEMETPADVGTSEDGTKSPPTLSIPSTCLLKNLETNLDRF